jgi:hypothetical protein
LFIARLRSLHGIRIGQAKLLFCGNRFLCYGMSSLSNPLRLRR